jgi:hypothetical protein
LLRAFSSHAQRVRLVNDELAAAIVAPELEQVFHAADRRHGQVQLPAVARATESKLVARNADLLREAHAGQPVTRIGNPECQHAGNPNIAIIRTYCLSPGVLTMRPSWQVSSIRQSDCPGAFKLARSGMCAGASCGDMGLWGES